MEQMGALLRALRLEQGLTLKGLADGCDVSTSFLSQAERGLCSVSIPTLERICAALGVTLSEFFARVGPTSSAVETVPTVLRSEEQHAVSLSDASIKYRVLSRDFPGRLFEVVIGEIPTGYVYPPASHDGEEFGYVLYGQLRLTLGEEEYVLRPGDSYHFGPYALHGYEAVGDEPVRLLWVQTLKDLKIRSGTAKEPA
jgi:transcriptional regulator with XRE-family HTH domain